MSYKVYLSVYLVVCPCIAFPFTSTLGVGDVKVYYDIFQPNPAHKLDLLGILGITILLPCGGINPQRIYIVHRLRNPPPQHDKMYIYVLASYLFVD